MCAESPATTRGATSLLSVILLTAIVVAGLGVVGAYGWTALQQSQESVNGAVVKHELQKLAGVVDAVLVGGSQDGTVDLELSTSQATGGGAVVPTAGQIELSIGTRTIRGQTRVCTGVPKTDGGTTACVEGSSTLLPVYTYSTSQLVSPRPLGSVRYGSPEYNVSYQAGGVWEKQAAMPVSQRVKSPPFRMRDPAGKPKTVMFNLYRITGDQGGVMNTVGVHQQGNATNYYPQRRVGRNTIVRVNITTQYPYAWAMYFRESWNMSARNVRVYEGAVGDGVWTVSVVVGSNEVVHLYVKEYRVVVTN